MSSPLPPTPAPASAPPVENAPQATTRFSLRAFFVLMVICAIVAALCRHSTWAFLVFGVPIMVHVVVSYALHSWKSSGYICLLVAMLTSLAGGLAYEYYEYTQSNHLQLYYHLPWSFVVIQTLGMSLFAGYVPIVLEFWLRLAFDGIMLLARGVKRIFWPAAPSRSSQIESR